MRVLIILLCSTWLSACAHFGRDSKAVIAAEHCYAYRYGDQIRRVNFMQAFDWCYRSANYGDINSQVLLAELYYLGLGGAKDPINAEHWYLKAAKQGHAHAQLMLYKFYKNSDNPEKMAHSLFWLQQAKAAGYKLALDEK